MSTLSTRFGRSSNRLYPHVVRRAGSLVAHAPPTGGLEELAGRRYCTVVTYRRSGEPIATPVWFGVVARFAEDVHFRFGGEHGLAIDCRDRDEAERWFARLFARFSDLRFEVEDVIVAGPPWDIRICTRYTTRATAGRRALVNRGVQVARLRWGRVAEDL